MEYYVCLALVSTLRSSWSYLYEHEDLAEYNPDGVVQNRHPSKEVEPPETLGANKLLQAQERQ